MDSIIPFLPLAGRTLVGLYFVFFGFWNIYHWRPLMNDLVEKNFPLPFLVLPTGIFWQIAAGSMIMANSYVKLAAISLLLFTLISVFIFNDFWNYQGEKRKYLMHIFVTNITIGFGSLLLLMNNIAPLLAFADFAT